MNELNSKRKFKTKEWNRWVYAVIGVIVLLMAGMVYAWSVMSQPIAAARPDWTTAQLSVTFTLVMAFFCIGNLTAGFLSKKVHPRIFIIISGGFLFAGFFMASMTADAPVLLYLGFGVLCGFGAGLAYNTVMSTVCAWFPDKQGLISGILLMGFGLSSFLIGKLYTSLAPADGSGTWSHVFQMFGAVIFVLMLLCSLFLKKPGDNFIARVSVKEQSVRKSDTDVRAGQMVKMPSFWLIYLWSIMVSAAGLSLVGQASGIATQVGIGVSDGTIATVAGLISIMNGVGRVIYGAMYDKAGYRLTMAVTMISFMIASLILIAALRNGNFAFIILGFLVGGFAYGGVTPIQSAIINDFYGRTYYSTNFSLIGSNLLIASFASTIAGSLYDMTQSYMSTIFMMILVTAAAFVIFWGIRRPSCQS